MYSLMVYTDGLSCSDNVANLISNLALLFCGIKEDYKNLEVLAFEMETAIASLEEQLAAAHGEKEEAISRNENLASELECLLDKLNISNSELSTVQEELSSLVSISMFFF